MKSVIKAKLDNGEIILMKKDRMGYRVINPIKDEDGSLNWKNFIAGGSWIKLLLTIAFVAVIVLAIFEYTNNISILLNCFENFSSLEICKESFGYNSNNTIWLP